MGFFGKKKTSESTSGQEVQKNCIYSVQYGSETTTIDYKKDNVGNSYYEIVVGNKTFYGIITTRNFTDIAKMPRYIVKQQPYFMKILEHESQISKYEDLVRNDEIAFQFAYLGLNNCDIDLTMSFIMDIASNKFAKRYEVADDSTDISKLTQSNLKVEEDSSQETEKVIYNFDFKDNRDLMGYEVHNNKLYEKVSLNPNTMNATLLYGAVGSGKSNTSRNAVEQVSQKYNCVFVIDPKAQSDYDKFLVKDNLKVNWGNLIGNYSKEEGNEKLKNIKYDIELGKKVVLFEYSGVDPKLNNLINPFISPYVEFLLSYFQLSNADKKSELEEFETYLESHSRFVQDTVYQLVSHWSDIKGLQISDLHIENFVADVISAMKTYIRRYEAIPESEWDTIMAISSLVTDPQIYDLMKDLKSMRLIDWNANFFLPANEDMNLIAIFRCNEDSAKFMSFYVQHWYKAFFEHVYDDKTYIGSDKNKKYLLVLEEFDKFLPKDDEKTIKVYQKKVLEFFKNSVSTTRGSGIDYLFITQSLGQVPKDLLKLIKNRIIMKLSSDAKELESIKIMFGKNADELIKRLLTDWTDGVAYFDAPLLIAGQKIKESKQNHELSGIFVKVLPKLGQINISSKIRQSARWNPNISFKIATIDGKKNLGKALVIEKTLKDRAPIGILLDKNAIPVAFCYLNSKGLSDSHMMANGITRSGKGVQITNFVGHSSLEGDGTIILDTKDNREWLGILNQDDFDYDKIWEVFKDGTKTSNPVYDKIYTKYLDHFKFELKSPVIDQKNFNALYFDINPEKYDYNSTIYMSNPEILIAFIKGHHYNNMSAKGHGGTDYFAHFEEYLETLKLKIKNKELKINQFEKYPDLKLKSTEAKSQVNVTAGYIVDIVKSLERMKFITFDSKQGLDIDVDIFPTMKNLIISAKPSFATYVYGYFRKYLLDNSTKLKRRFKVICEEASDYLGESSSLYGVNSKEYDAWFSQDTYAINYVVITQYPEQISSKILPNIGTHCIMRYDKLPDQLQGSLGKEFNKIDLLLNKNKEFKVKMMAYNDNNKLYLSGSEISTGKKDSKMIDNKYMLILPPQLDNRPLNETKFKKVFKEGKILKKN